MMGGVHCPACEGIVDANAHLCMTCGHDLSAQGPITSTGHDLNQLRDAIRHRDDLSMAQKFDLIAQVETGANPILLGIAAASVDPGFNQEPSQGAGDGVSNPAVLAAVAASVPAEAYDEEVMGSDPALLAALAAGLQASLHIEHASNGTGSLIDAVAMAGVPRNEPPTRGFCPQCGSDILRTLMNQWTKWNGRSESVTGLRLDAALMSALLHHRHSEHSAPPASEPVDVEALRAELRNELEAELRPALEAEIRTSMAKDVASSPIPSTQVEEAVSTKEPDEEPATSKRPDADSDPTPKGTSSPKAKPKPTPKPKQKPKSKPRAKSGGLFGAKTPKRKYEGPPEGKMDWFLNEALDTVYDPHGTGKVLKRRAIIARSSDGNVRVEDIVRSYVEGGKEAVPELAWTAPQTEYILQAYDAC